jgi:HEAT repeat protein
MNSSVGHCRLACLTFLIVTAYSGLPQGRADEPGKYLNRTAASWAEDLQHSDARHRRAAAFALGRLNSAALPHLATLSKTLRHDQDPAVRAAAAATLGELGTLSPGGAVSALVQSLEKDPDLAVKRTVAEALGKLGDRAAAAQPALTRSLQSADPGLRQNAAWALGNLGKAAIPAAPALAALLEDPEAGVRRRAISALGNLGSDAEDVLPQVLRGLTDHEAGVREIAVVALRQIGSRAFSAVDPLLSIAEAKDQPLALRKAALVSIEQIWPTGPKATLLWGRLVRLAEKDTDAEVRGHAADTVKKIAPRRQE